MLLQSKPNNLSRLCLKTNCILVPIKAPSRGSVSAMCYSGKCKICDGSHSALLIACMNDPTLKLIDHFLQGNPSAILDVNCEKKLPLHLACEYGASPEVIKRLTYANKKAVRQKDINGLLPIHLACRSYFHSISQYLPKILAEKFLEETLQHLVSTDPSTVMEEDDDETCPLEHAINSKLSLNIVKRLQNTSKVVRRINQIRGKVHLKSFNSISA